MAETFVNSMEALVTKDYLNARFNEQNAVLEKRFSVFGWA